MICIDTDVFIRDLLDPNDDKALMSRKFMEETSSIVRCTTIFNISDSDGFCGFQKMSEETYSSFAPWCLGVSLI
ncbi:MAG: hypothetical protein C5S47_06160 [Candidatus Methanogasteraceae archaeon]|nr:MAG: hypothetical protein C5S47_06160 [ANME-2 cluster archaeon]